MPARCDLRLSIASSNPGKQREYRELARNSTVELSSISNFHELPTFNERFPTFAENAAGKALHYSRLTRDQIVADDSGLVVPALGGAPGVRSARYAGPHATDEDRYAKLLRKMEDKHGENRRARFVCVVAISCDDRILIVTSDCASGIILREPRGNGGFGYDPVFLVPEIGKTFAEASLAERSQFSHRARAFHKALFLLAHRRSFLLP